MRFNGQDVDVKDYNTWCTCLDIDGSLESPRIFVQLDRFFPTLVAQPPLLGRGPTCTVPLLRDFKTSTRLHELRRGVRCFGQGLR